MPPALIGWNPLIAKSLMASVGVRELLGNYEPAQPRRKQRKTLPAELLCSTQRIGHRVFLWTEITEKIMPEERSSICQSERAQVFLSYSVRGIQQFVDKLHIGVSVPLKSTSYSLKTKECYKPLKRKPEHVREGYIEPQTRTREYPPRFQAELDYLKGLTAGWGEGHELAPVPETLRLVIETEKVIRGIYYELRSEQLFPRLTPGPGGQVQLAYSRKTTGGKWKDFLIQISGDMESMELLILRGVKDKRGAVLDLESATITSFDDLKPSVQWFVTL